MPSNPATDKAKGNDGELVELVGGRLSQNADCVGEQGPRHEHAHSDKAN